MLRCIAANDLLQEPDLDSLVLVPAPDLRLTHELVPTPEARGGWTIDESRLRLIEGLAPAGGADPVVVRFVGLLNGVKTLGAVIAELAQEFEASPDKLGPSPAASPARCSSAACSSPRAPRADDPDE